MMGGNGNNFPTNYTYTNSGAPWRFEGYRVAGASPPPHAAAGLPVDTASLRMVQHEGSLSNFAWSLPTPAVPHIGKRSLPPLPVAQANPDGPARRASFTQRATGDATDRLMRRGASPEPQGPTMTRATGGWQARQSKYQEPGRTYYVNRLTGQRAWDAPPETPNRTPSSSDPAQSFPGYSGAIGHQAPGLSGRAPLSTEGGTVGVNTVNRSLGPAGQMRVVDDLANRRSPGPDTRHQQLALVAAQGRTESASPARQGIAPSGAAFNSWHD